MTLQKPRFFDLEEFLDSSVARQKGISNNPSWEVIEHLNELALFLDDLREAWGSGIKVTSGFRNTKLNDAVNGAEKSLHKTGWAADIVPANGKYEAFVRFLRDWVKDKSWDQIIEEKKGKTRWIHLAIYNNKHQQRKMFFNITMK